MQNQGLPPPLSASVSGPVGMVCVRGRSGAERKDVRELASSARGHSVGVEGLRGVNLLQGRLCPEPGGARQAATRRRLD